MAMGSIPHIMAALSDKKNPAKFFFSGTSGLKDMLDSKQEWIGWGLVA